LDIPKDYSKGFPLEQSKIQLTIIGAMVEVEKINAFVVYLWFQLFS
jgi:hypothetical protein